MGMILSKIAEDFNTYFDMDYSSVTIGHKIRQIHLAHGCQHKCLHCFANAPSRLKSQMTLSHFERVAIEMGDCLRETGKEFNFLYFGASTDPSMVNRFFEYVNIWLDNTPVWHQLKIFSHGWMLFEQQQKQELLDFLKIAQTRPNRFYKFAVSFDGFSVLARTKWDKYVQNIADNLRYLKQNFPIEKMRLEVMYPVSSLDILDPRYTFAYWVEKMSLDRSQFEICRQFVSREPISVSHTVPLQIIRALINFVDSKVFSLDELVKVYREAGTPFPGGRGSRMFKDVPEQYQKRAIAKQKSHSLVNLSQESTLGVSLMPDGTATIIDMVCYQEIAKLSGRNYFQR